MSAGSRPPLHCTRSRAATAAVGACVVALAALGVVLRMWLLAHDPIDSDQAVVGLMARSILHGHFPVFYWGQPYGGVEPYVTAALVAVSGLHPWVVNATPAILVAVAAVLTWRLGLAVCGSQGASVVAAALMWAWSEVDLWNSTREYGFRGVVLVCSITVLLATVHLLEDDRRIGSWLLLGAAAALGWWASPEILYVALPCLPVVIWIASRGVRKRGIAALVPVGAGSAVAVVVLVPWLVATVHDHFASISEATADQGAGAMGYLGRLGVFFVHTLPMVLGARLQITGSWLGGRPTGVAILAATVAVVVVGAAAAAWWLAPARLLVAVVVLYPFLEAAMGPTFYWQDARYGMYLPPIAVVVAAAGWNRLLEGSHGSRSSARLTTHSPPGLPSSSFSGAGIDGVSHAGFDDGGAPVGLSPDSRAGFDGDGARAVLHQWRRAGAAVVACTLAATSTVAGLVAATSIPGVPTATDFAETPTVLVGHPDGIGRSVTTGLLDDHLTDVYADYWVAYDLDLLAPGLIAATPPDIVRAPSLAEAVGRADHSAWLFVGPTAADVAACDEQFQNPSPEPFGMSQDEFEAMLTANHIKFRARAAGPMTAVVPDPAVSPQWVSGRLASGH